MKSSVATTLPSLCQLDGGASRDLDSQSLAAILPTALPSERDYSCDVNMAAMHSVCSLFRHLLDCANQQPSCASESLTDTLSLLQPVSAIMLSSCPVSCYDLLVSYLQNSASVHTSADVEFAEIRRFCSLLPDVIIKPFGAIGCHPNIVKLKEMTMSLEPLCGTLF